MEVAASITVMAHLSLVPNMTGEKTRQKIKIRYAGRDWVIEGSYGSSVANHKYLPLSVTDSRFAEFQRRSLKNLRHIRLTRAIPNRATTSCAMAFCTHWMGTCWAIDTTTKGLRSTASAAD